METIEDIRDLVDPFVAWVSDQRDVQTVALVVYTLARGKRCLVYRSCDPERAAPNVP